MTHARHPVRLLRRQLECNGAGIKCTDALYDDKWCIIFLFSTADKDMDRPFSLDGEVFVGEHESQCLEELRAGSTDLAVCE